MDIVHLIAKIPTFVGCLICLIVSLLFFFSERYMRTLRPIGRELDTAAKVLRAFKSPITGEKLEELKDQLTTLSYFKGPWEEFRETLVLVDTKDGAEVVYNTRRASEFINPEMLIEHHLNVYWYQALPTILTGLGLIGTFVSILYGLNELHVDPGSGQVSGIDAFINSLSGKFTSSVVGLASAIIFLAIEKYNLGALNNQCVKIEQQLDRMFPQRVSEEILADMLKHLEEQSNNFRNFGSELANHMKQSFQESIVPTMDRLASAIDEMLIAAERLQQQKEESATAVIEKIATTFQTAITERAGDDISRLASSLKDTATFAEQMNSSVGTLLSHSEHLLTAQQEQANAQAETMQKALDRMIVQVDSSLTRQQESADRHIDQLGQSFARLIGNLEESNTSFIESLRSTVSDMLEKNRLWAQSFHRQFQESLEQQSTFNVELQDKVANSIESALNQMQESFSQQLESANASIDVVINKLQDWARSTNQELIEYAKALSAETEALTVAGHAVKDAAGGLEDSFKQQKSFLVEVSGVGTSITTASQTLSNSTDNLKTVYEHSSEALNRIMEQVNKADLVMKEVDSLLQQQKSVYSTLDETIGRTLVAVNQAVREYSEHTKESLGHHLTTFDKHLADASNQLQGTVLNLEEHLSELTDMLERTLPASAAASN